MKSKLLSAFLCVTLLCGSAQLKGPDGKCRALALRGGGTKGAYEVGALKALTEQLDPIETQYDVVVGVSIGAINSAILAIHEKGTEKEAVKYLENLWRTSQAQDLWQTWPYVSIVGGLWKNSFLDAQPLHDMVAKTIGNKTFYRKVAFQSVDLNTGTVVIFDETTPPELMSEAISSSASIPPAFQPTIIDGMTLVDGGVFTNLDLGEAIVRCREEVSRDEDIIVDIVLCMGTPVTIDQWTADETKWKTAYQFVQRKNQLKAYFSDFEDVARVVRGYPNVQFRYLISPSEPLPTQQIPIFATTAQVEFQLALGEKDAINIIKQGKYYRYAEVIEEMGDEQ